MSAAPPDGIATLRAWFQSLADGETPPENMLSLEVPAAWPHDESTSTRDSVARHCVLIAYRLKSMLWDVSWASAPQDVTRPRRRSPDRAEAEALLSKVPTHARALQAHGMHIAQIIAKQLARIDEPAGDVFAYLVTHAIDVTLDMCEDHRAIHSISHLPVLTSAWKAEYAGRVARERATIGLPARNEWIRTAMMRERASERLSFTAASEAVSKALPRALGAASAKTVRRVANGLKWPPP